MRDADAVAAMLCPVCKTGLAMSDRQGVEIDYCPQCRGVWLDRGELDKIIDPTAGHHRPAPPPAQSFSDDDRGRFDERSRAPWGGGYGGSHDKRRKRSFLENLFDSAPRRPPHSPPRVSASTVTRACRSACL